jgi:hypothetical protein
MSYVWRPPWPPLSWGFSNLITHVVGLLWMSDQLVAKGLYRHRITYKHKHPCPKRDSNPQSRQPRPTPWPRGHRNLLSYPLPRIISGAHYYLLLVSLPPHRFACLPCCCIQWPNVETKFRENRWNVSRFVNNTDWQHSDLITSLYIWKKVGKNEVWSH